MTKSNKKEQYFEKELNDFDLTSDTKDYIRDKMLLGLEIMTKKEITKCIEDHLELIGE